MKQNRTQAVRQHHPGPTITTLISSRLRESDSAKWHSQDSRTIRAGINTHQE